MNHYISLLMFPAIALGIFSGFPVAFSLLGVAFLFGVIGFGDGVIPLGVGLTYKVATSYVLAAVPLFVFMGCLLASTRITDGLLVAAESWVGHFKGGGVAIATILVCIIFAASTGIIGSAEIVIGLVALPAMLKLNYDKGLASGVICAGGSLGTIIPPSVVIIVLGPAAGVSVARLLVGAIFPGLLLAASYIASILVRTGLKPSLAPPLATRRIKTTTERKTCSNADFFSSPAYIVFYSYGNDYIGNSSSH